MQAVRGCRRSGSLTTLNLYPAPSAENVLMSPMTEHTSSIVYVQVKKMESLPLAGWSFHSPSAKITLQLMRRCVGEERRARYEASRQDIMGKVCLAACVSRRDNFVHEF